MRDSRAASPMIAMKRKGASMGSLRESMDEYRRQLQKGAIQEAYRGLMEYMMGLRTHLANKYPDSLCVRHLQRLYGHDLLLLLPKSLKGRDLKVAIVFVHENFRFEAWLAGYNKQVQARYWKVFKENGWNMYRLVPTTKGVDAIMEHVLVEDPDFGDPDGLTRQIETGTAKFIEDVEGFLSEREG